MPGLPKMIELRGIQDEFSITLKGRDWPEMMDDLASRLGTPNGATKDLGARVWLDAADCPPSPSEVEQLVWLLEMHGVKLEWWMDDVKPGRRESRPEETDLQREEIMKLPPRDTGPEKQESDGLEKEEQNLWSEAAMVSRTLRSGQLVRFGGSVVVFGDVNPGAVVVADGSVIVWGRMRGVVHAGAAGDDKAVVGALELAPAQLRIAGLVARGSDLQRDPAPFAELARTRHGRIVFEDWDDAKG